MRWAVCAGMIEYRRFVNRGIFMRERQVSIVMKYYCNPLNVNYRYQFNDNSRRGSGIQICREAADPSMICFRGQYYILLP